VRLSTNSVVTNFDKQDVFCKSTGGERRALGHRLCGSLDGMAWADAEACPGRRYEQDQPAVHPEQNGGEPAARMRGMDQSGEQSGRPRNGTKRARIGKASGSADRSFDPDAVRYMSVTIATP
jgi:hypothetical protein